MMKQLGKQHLRSALYHMINALPAEHRLAELLTQLVETIEANEWRKARKLNAINDNKGV